MAHISMKLYVAFSLVALLAVAVWLGIIDHGTIAMLLSTVAATGVYMISLVGFLPFILMGWLIWRFGKRPTG